MGGERSEAGPFTFAIVGRDEARTLPGVLAQAQEAARPGDRVWFVDSGSRDDSVALAGRLGVEVIEAPEGKGRAMAAALERCDEGYICFLDGDLVQWEINIPAALRAEVLATGADMVIGMFEHVRRRAITPAIYWPLVDALFPDFGRRCDPRPLSGLRVLDATFPVGALPPGYGVETHLNLAFGAGGGPIATTHLGAVHDSVRNYANVLEVSEAVAEAILAFAVAHGRLEAELRPDWERWVEAVLEVLAAVPPPGAEEREFLESLSALAARPLPPARAMGRAAEGLR